MNARHSIVVLIAGWLWLSAALADTVRMKTGVTYEGTIVSETDTKVSIEVEYAGGTILSTESINKDEIAGLFSKLLGGAVDVHVSPVRDLARTVGGKREIIVSTAS